MRRPRKRQLTLGDLIQTVAHYSRTDHEVGLTVADLIGRGIVRFKPTKRKP